MNKPRFWHCIIGPCEHGDLPGDADAPMRQAVKAVLAELTGHEAEICSTGWGMTPAEKEAVINMPSIP